MQNTLRSIKNRILNYKCRFLPLTKLLILLLSAVLIHFVVTSLTLPLSVTSIIQNSFKTIFPHVVVVLFLWVVFSQKGFLGSVLAISTISAFFALLLAYFWNTGYTFTTQMWGFIPTSDALTYYVEAYGLLAGDPITGGASFRPLFTTFLSSLLLLANYDLKILLSSMVVLNALAAFLAAHQIKTTHGALAAAIFIWLEIVLYRRFAGTIMSEQLGFILGNLALAFLWYGVSARKNSAFFMGLLSLSLGLNIRPGAMLVLGTIVLWFLWHNRKSKIKKLLTHTAISFVVIVIPIFIQVTASNSFVGEEGRLYEGFGRALYGLASGSSSLNLYVQENPGGSDRDAMNQAIHMILDNPRPFVIQVTRVIKDYFVPSTCNVFCFAGFYNNYLKAFLYTLLIVTILVSINNFSKPLYSLILFFFIGVVISLPMAPTSLIGHRTHTVTNPFIISMLIVSFPAIKDMALKILGRRDNQNCLFIRDSNCLLNRFETVGSIFIGVMISLVIILPYILVPLTPKTPETIKCANNQVPIGFFTKKNSWVHVQPENEFPSGIKIPQVSFSEAEEKAHEPYPQKQGYENLLLAEDIYITIVPFNYLSSDDDWTRGPFWLVADSNSISKLDGFIALCGARHNLSNFNGRLITVEPKNGL